MKEKKIILTIDQGTTSTRALLYSFNENKIIGIAQKEFKQYFPKPGWVEHDLDEIWETVLTTCKEVVAKTGITFKDITAMGITNQRETIGFWNKKSGKPVAPAIVWQDRRTSDYCNDLKKQGLEKKIQEKTGLPIDPYFSASKINWALSNNPVIQKMANEGDLCIGTIDTFLVWKFSEGAAFFTDITNACRTSLYNINTLEWDDELLEIFSVPKSSLAKVKACDAFFGETKVFDAPIPIHGIAGDQQASLLGHAGIKKDMMKITYGTGAFLLVNTGEEKVHSNNQLLTTVAFQLEKEKKLNYALEGSIFVAGSALKWLKEKVGLINNYNESTIFADNLPSNQGVYLVPSFTGLGTPYWNPKARGAILGMSLDTDKKIITRAVLESLAYQTYDLVKTLNEDSIFPQALKVDGGVSVNNWLLNFMADLLGFTIIRPKVLETTALGATYLAALGSGILSSLNDLENYVTIERAFENENQLNREELIAGWNKAIKCVQEFSTEV